MGGDVLDGQHGLLARGLDLRRGQQEAVVAGVAQLEGVGVLHSQVVGPVVGAAGSGVCRGGEPGGVGWGGVRTQAG